MTIIQAIILSLVEGFTEFLPISSTGHLILTQHFLGVSSTEFTKSFSIIIQLAAIFAVIILFWTKIIRSKHLIKQLIIAFIPTGILGFTLYKYIKGYLLDNVTVTVFALFLGGLILLLVDSTKKFQSGQHKSKDLTPIQLVKIGLFQSLSMIPGVSRSAASIVGGLTTGLSRIDAVEFSFLLAIPTMAAASGYDLLKTGFSFNSHEIFLLSIGSLFSFLSAFMAVKTFIKFVGKHNFTIFAIYRILLALLVWFTLKP